MAMATSKGCENDDESKRNSDILIRSISDAKNTNVWYELNIPGLEKILPRVGHSLLPINNKEINIFGGGQYEGAMAEIWKIHLLVNESATDGEDAASMDRVRLCPAVEGNKARYEFVCAVQKSDGDEEEKTKKSTEESPSLAFGSGCKIWIFGGANSKITYNDVGYIQNGSWVESLTTGSIPRTRTQGGNSSILEYKGKEYLIVFGGGQAGVDAVDDGNLYVFDINEQTWTIVEIKSDTPQITQGHVMTSFGSKIFIYGGLNGTSLHDRLHMVDIAPFLETGQSVSWVLVEQQQSKKPAGRAAHGIVKHPIESSKSFFIFGGLGEYGFLDDLWEFNTESLSWTELVGEQELNERDLMFLNSTDNQTSPSPRLGLAMTSICIDSIPYLLIHGGINSKGEMYNDLWVRKLE